MMSLTAQLKTSSKTLASSIKKLDEGASVLDDVFNCPVKDII